MKDEGRPWELDDGGKSSTVHVQSYIVHKAKGKPKSINRSTGVDRDEQEIRIES